MNLIWGDGGSFSEEFAGETGVNMNKIHCSTHELLHEYYF